MTLTVCDVTLGGQVLLGAKDDKGEYYVGSVATEDALELRRDSLRQKLASKSLKSALGEVSNSVKRKVGKTFMNFLPAKDYTRILGYFAYYESNKKAQDILMACLNEAIERRIDNALGEKKTEEQYEEGTRELFRELSRRYFHPKLTKH